MFVVKMTKGFEKHFHKIIPLHLQKSLWKRINKLRDNPFIGKPLGDESFRELKADKFRIYFMVYKEKVLVLIVGVSDKKKQQTVIDTIKENRHLLDEFVKNLNLE